MSEPHQAVLERLVRMLADDFQVAPDTVTRDSHLRTDLGLDSLSLTDLAFLVQQDFGFKAAPEAFRGITTVGHLVDFVATQSNSPAPA
jgi:acyl carrier protein